MSWAALSKTTFAIDEIVEAGFDLKYTRAAANYLYG